jgi:hypothetical protein
MLLTGVDEAAALVTSNRKQVQTEAFILIGNRQNVGIDGPRQLVPAAQSDGMARGLMDGRHCRVRESCFGPRGRSIWGEYLAPPLGLGLREARSRSGSRSVEPRHQRAIFLPDHSIPGRPHPETRIVRSKSRAWWRSVLPWNTHPLRWHRCSGPRSSNLPGPRDNTFTSADLRFAGPRHSNWPLRN